MNPSTSTKFAQFKYLKKSNYTQYPNHIVLNRPQNVVIKFKKLAFLCLINASFKF